MELAAVGRSFLGTNCKDGGANISSEPVEKAFSLKLFQTPAMD